MARFRAPWSLSPRLSSRAYELGLVSIGRGRGVTERLPSYESSTVLAGRVIDEVASDAGASRDDILSDCRVRHVTKARQIICARLFVAGMSKSEIGHQLGLNKSSVGRAIQIALTEKIEAVTSEDRQLISREPPMQPPHGYPHIHTDCCRALWCSVLKTAWMDALYPSHGSLKREVDANRAWFGTGAYRLVCAAAGIDADFVLKRFHEVLADRNRRVTSPFRRIAA